AAVHLPESGGVDNPIDLDGAGEKDLSVYSRLVDVLLDDESIDAVVLSGYFGCYGQDIPELLDTELAEVDRLGRIVNGHRKPLIVHSMSADSQAVAGLWECGIPSYASIEAAMRVLARAGFYASHAGRITEAHELSGAITPWSAGYSAARETMAAAGVPVPWAVTLGRGDELTEVGGLAWGLKDTTAVASAHADMVARLGEGEYVLEEMDSRDGVVEILVGGRQDENFGPIVMVGAGGTETELYGDTWLELAPVS